MDKLPQASEELKQEISSKYIIIKTLGTGAFATVYLSTCLRRDEILTSLTLNPTVDSNITFHENTTIAIENSDFPPPDEADTKVKNLFSKPFKMIKDGISESFGAIMRLSNPLKNTSLTALKVCKIKDSEAAQSLRTGAEVLKALESLLMPLSPAYRAPQGFDPLSRIVKVLDFFETKSFVCLGLELIHGKELFEYILEKCRLQQNSASYNSPNTTVPNEKLQRSALDIFIVKKIMKDLFQTIEFIHAAGVSHGDIKLENIMVLENPHSSQPEIKLIDFGLATKCEPTDMIVGIPRGSPQYFPPEAVLVLPRNPMKLDIWACGVVFFALLTLRMPFASALIGSRNRNQDSGSDVDSSANRRSLARKIATGTVEWTDLEKDVVPLEARELVTKILAREEPDRLNVKEILSNKFFLLRHPFSDSSHAENFDNL